MKSSTELVEMESYLSNELDSSFLDSVNEAVKQIGINVKKDVSSHEYHIMEQYMNGELNWIEVNQLIKKYGDKLMCQWVSGGNMAEFIEYKKDLQALELADKQKQNDENPMCVSVEEGKQFQDRLTGDHAPSHSTHLGNGLGSNHGFVSRNDCGIVWMLYQKGIIREITISETKKMIFDLKGVVISDVNAEMIKKRIDKDRKVKEGQLIQGQTGDSKLVVDAISIITNKGKEEGLSYEKTNRLGKNARKMVDQVKDMGKIAGRAQVTEDKEDLEKKVAKSLINFADAGKMDITNIIECMCKMKGIKFW